MNKVLTWRSVHKVWVNVVQQLDSGGWASFTRKEFFKETLISFLKWVRMILILPILYLKAITKLLVNMNSGLENLVGGYIFKQSSSIYITAMTEHLHKNFSVKNITI